MRAIAKMVCAATGVAGPACARAPRVVCRGVRCAPRGGPAHKTIFKDSSAAPVPVHTEITPLRLDKVKDTLATGDF